jgi:RNA polymerase sigma-70 factor (ECF subfamily)
MEHQADEDSHPAEDPLVTAVRNGDAAAWQTLIERFEGRLLAFARSRIGDRESSEDIVQETFIGFLTSLPNYDSRRPLESYLFSICAYKIADHLRRQGRRPNVRSGGGGEGDSDDPLARLSGGRVASSIARSVERKRLEESAITQAIGESVARWKEKGDWQKLKCLELLLVVGMPNREVAATTGLTEQQVANYKSDFLIRLKSTLTKAGLDSDVFPELQG